MTFDGKAFGLEIVSAVKAHIGDVLAPIVARLEAVERRFDEFPTPKDGKDADPHQAAALAAERILPELKELRSAVEAIKPAPELPDVAAMVSQAVAALPVAKDGAPGADGKDGADGREGPAGTAGRDGLDAVEFLRSAEDHLIVTLSNGTTRDLGAFVGKDGAAGRDGDKGIDGKDGTDGVGFDDLELVETEAGVFLRCVRGDVVKEWRLPIVTDRGVFKDGHTYRKGDGVTWGGSFWIAQDETTDKPDSGKGWRLAVKKGRDGKDGTMKEAPKPTPIKVG